MKLILFVLLYASNCVCRIEQCEMEDNIHYNGNDDKMPDGKLKCTGGSLCTQNPITDASSCKSFCSTSKYFTWKASAKVCYCKNSDSTRSQEGGTVSGKTNCNEQCEMEDNVHYNGNDDKMPDGKLKCTGGSLCTQNPITDASSCKSFCSTSKYFTWKASAKVCYCKNSDSRRSQEGGTVSGKTNCPYNE